MTLESRMCSEIAVWRFQEATLYTCYSAALQWDGWIWLYQGLCQAETRRKGTDFILLCRIGCIHNPGVKWMKSWRQTLTARLTIYLCALARWGTRLPIGNGGPIFFLGAKANLEEVSTWFLRAFRYYGLGFQTFGRSLFHIFITWERWALGMGFMLKCQMKIHYQIQHDSLIKPSKLQETFSSLPPRFLWKPLSSLNTIHSL